MVLKKIASIVLVLVFTAISIPCLTIKVAAMNDTKAIIYAIDENTNDIITNVTFELKTDEGISYEFEKEGEGEYALAIGGDETILTPGSDGKLTLTYLDSSDIYGLYPLSEDGYVYDFACKTFTVSDDDVTEVVVKMYKKTGSLHLDVKDDNGNPVNNATFTITNNNNELMLFSQKSGYYKTDVNGSPEIQTSQGTLMITDMPVGIYTLYQTVNDDAYVSSNIETTIEITQNAQTSTSIVNIKKKGTVSVTAFDNKNNALNVEMHVKNNTNKSSLTFTKLAEGQYQYDERGTATVSSFDGVLILMNMPVGEYEIEPFENEKHKNVGSKIITVDDTPIAVDFKFQIAEGTLCIKHEADTDKNIEYAIFDEEGNQYSFVKNGTGSYKISADGEKLIKLDSDKDLYIYDVPVGTIFVQESIDGNVKSKKKATIFKNQKSVYTNNGVINNFIYTKNEKGEPLPNIAVIFECGDIKEGKQSDANGKIDISNLIDGNYKVHTVAVPSTYSNVEDIQIAISNGSVAEESAITIKNTVLKLQIEGISGPVDVLLEGENHSDQVQSTADGEALFLNIPYGDYVIKIGNETSEPKANISIDETYYNGDPVYISITQDNLIENDEENADVAEENTSSKKIIVCILVFIMSAAATTFIVFLKKRNEH